MRVGLQELRRRAVKGRCLCCPRAARARALLCGLPECNRLYLRAWHVDNRRAHPERYGDAFYRAKEAASRRRHAACSPCAPSRAAAPARPAGSPPSRGYYVATTVPLLGSGESYAAFCRRVERGWLRMEQDRRG
jgi:hypothetical protein